MLFCPFNLLTVYSFICLFRPADPFIIWVESGKVRSKGGNASGKKGGRLEKMATVRSRSWFTHSLNKVISRDPYTFPHCNCAIYLIEYCSLNRSLKVMFILSFLLWLKRICFDVVRTFALQVLLTMNRDHVLLGCRCK